MTIGLGPLGSGRSSLSLLYPTAFPISHATPGFRGPLELDHVPIAATVQTLQWSPYTPASQDHALAKVRREMTLLNPYTLILPFLFVFTIPIAIFASITTTLAFSILVFRVLLVYVELAFAVIPYWILGPKQSGQVLQGTKSSPSPPSVPARRRKRRGSTCSSLSATGTITPISGDAMRFSQSIGASRDFEGVGGWRLDNPSDDDDSLWTKINSRLELPADHGRRHHRSLTAGGSPSDSKLNRGYSPEAIINTSRPRTPPFGPVGDGPSLQSPISTKSSKRTASAHTSGSSGSSGRSCVMNMKQQ